MKRIFFAIALIFFLSSCASLCSTSASEVNINSDPRDARVQIFNRKDQLVYDGRTPALVTLKHASAFFRRARYRVRITLEGYDPREVTLYTTVQGWYWGNFFIAGAIGFFIVDPATGAMYKFETHDIRETLSRSGHAGIDFAPGAAADSGRGGAGSGLSDVGLSGAGRLNSGLLDAGRLGAGCLDAGLLDPSSFSSVPSGPMLKVVTLQSVPKELRKYLEKI